MLVICLLVGYVSTAIPSEIDEQTLRDQADREFLRREWLAGLKG